MNRKTLKWVLFLLAVVAFNVIIGNCLDNKFIRVICSLILIIFGMIEGGDNAKESLSGKIAAYEIQNRVFNKFGGIGKCIDILEKSKNNE